MLTGDPSYLIRAEMLAFHEGEVAYTVNPRRGTQFYPNCVQIEVVGNGTVALPEGVSFPGAYKEENPGIVYDVRPPLFPSLSTQLLTHLLHKIYCSTATNPIPTTPCTTTYPIPGPTVWSGAWAETTAVPLGPVKGDTTAYPWSTWIVNSVVTSGSFTTKAHVTVVGTSTYEASWSTTYQTPAPGTRRW